MKLNFRSIEGCEICNIGMISEITHACRIAVDRESMASVFTSLWRSEKHYARLSSDHCRIHFRRTTTDQIVLPTPRGRGLRSPQIISLFFKVAKVQAGIWYSNRSTDRRMARVTSVRVVYRESIARAPRRETKRVKYRPRPISVFLCWSLRDTCKPCSLFF